MTEAYTDALNEQIESNIWRTMREEAVNMPNVQRVQLAADIAGIFDPTPISDGVGAVTSAMQGDVWGVGFSLLGMIPYVGDLGKIGKISRIAPRTGRALEAFFNGADEIAAAGRAGLRAAGLSLDQVAAARRAATERVRAAMRQVRRGNPNCADCAKLRSTRRQPMPQDGPNGTWRNGPPGPDGNGVFEFAEPKVLPDGSTVSSIEYRDGFPVFDDYVLGGPGGRHSLWEMTGDAADDADLLTEQLLEANPNYIPPDTTGYNLHHFEDGTVGYVPEAIHLSSRGGVAHAGGNSIINNDLF
ncbi:MAG: hypothetical protein AAGA15_06260 [Pseudomonadota bacterium]